MWWHSKGGGDYNRTTGRSLAAVGVVPKKEKSCPVLIVYVTKRTEKGRRPWFPRLRSTPPEGRGSVGTFK